MPRRTLPIAVALLAAASHAYVWWGQWGEASHAVWIASAVALAGAGLGALLPGSWLRSHVAIAAGLMLAVSGFAGARVIGRWPFAWDAMPDPRYAGFLAVMGLAIAIGLVRGALWARWAAIAFAVSTMLGGALNTIHLVGQRDETLWLAGSMGALGGLTVLSQLIRPGVGARFARAERHALWTSTDRLVRVTRWAAIANFAAAPMLLLYALGQPVAPATVVSALVIAPVLGLGGGLVIARRSAGIVVLALGGFALIAHTVATATHVTLAADLPVAGYYAAFWLPAALLAITAGLLAARRA